MKLLIDTNVILDMVFKRSGCDISMELFRQVKEAGASAYITASSVTDLFYIIRKETHDTSRTYAVMENIFQLVAILSVTDKDIMDAFGQKWKDFEDCVQYMTGKNSRMDYIITGNRKDYADALLPVMTPATWIEMVKDL
ncbi:MAG: PIN domain-containing protein [Lachnospiraceae bacterium]|jgi:predicted nucleic acid-binding protein|nr:PIN domain-containing protein [Lachnospiraceae bacterium]